MPPIGNRPSPIQPQGPSQNAPRRTKIPELNLKEQMVRDREMMGQKDEWMRSKGWDPNKPFDQMRASTRSAILEFQNYFAEH